MAAKKTHIPHPDLSQCKDTLAISWCGYFLIELADDKAEVTCKKCLAMRKKREKDE